MRQSDAILADIENFGRISRCEHGHFHVQVGHATLSFSQDGYMKFVDLVNTSAANFESLFHHADFGVDHACGNSSNGNPRQAHGEDLC